MQTILEQHPAAEDHLNCLFDVLREQINAKTTSDTESVCYSTGGIIVPGSDTGLFIELDVKYKVSTIALEPFGPATYLIDFDSKTAI